MVFSSPVLAIVLHILVCCNVGSFIDLDVLVLVLLLWLGFSMRNVGVNAFFSTMPILCHIRCKCIKTDKAAFKNSEKISKELVRTAYLSGGYSRFNASHRPCFYFRTTLMDFSGFFSRFTWVVLWDYLSRIIRAPVVVYSAQMTVEKHRHPAKNL